RILAVRPHAPATYSQSRGSQKPSRGLEDTVPPKSAGCGLRLWEAAAEGGVPVLHGYARREGVQNYSVVRMTQHQDYGITPPEDTVRESCVEERPVHVRLRARQSPSGPEEFFRCRVQPTHCGEP